jgi:D-glycerate 3-kinase
MTHDQITEFVHYFWRSVHPGIHIKNLVHDTEHTNQVVIINDDHSVGEMLTPEEAIQRYP